MEILLNELQKYFENNSEKLECHIDVFTETNKKKRAFLCLTLSLNKPNSINIYIVKGSERSEIKRKLVANAKNISAVDCHDHPDQPCYDIELICTDGKAKRIFANLIEDKHRFIERLMRVMYIHDMDLFKTIKFNNLPISINLDKISSEGITDYDVEKTEQDPALIDVTDYKRYQNLSAVEEENMQKFLNESSEAVINAIEFQETLKQHLLAMEGTNVHSIMSSEDQMLKLMECLDQAIEQVELLESKIDVQDKFLAEVEESMLSLRDRDEVIRLTAHNRDEMQKTLEELLCHITFDNRYYNALQNFDLSKTESVILAKEATEKLQYVLEAPKIEGLEHLCAVKEKTVELNRAADDFTRKFATQFNNTLTRQLQKLMGLSTGNSDKILDAHRFNRKELIPTCDFMAWLKINRLKTFCELQKLYIEKMASVYDHEVTVITDSIRAKLMSKDKNVSMSLKSSSSVNLKFSDKLRTKNASETSSTISESGRMSESGMFNIGQTGLIIFEDLLSKLKLLVLEEEEFMTRLFRLDCRRSSERKHTDSNSVPPMEPHVYLITVSNQVFYTLCNHLKTLIQVLEQHDSSQSLLMVVIVNRQFDDLVRSSEFLQLSWAALFTQTKRSFNSYIDKFILSFRDCKIPRRSRCGILPIVTIYSSFAEQTVLAFQDSSRQNDLIIAHQKIIRELITQIDKIACESVKAPKDLIVLENHHCLIDILRRLHWSELDELLAELKSKYQESLDSYVITCVGRPFDKLYMFFENVKEAIDSGIRPADIGYQFAFSKTELKKVIKEYPGREVKKGLEHLCKKVEKYISEDSSLFQVIWLSIQKQFIAECLRYESLIEKCYPNSKISLEFSTTELVQFFKEIASTH